MNELPKNTTTANDEIDLLVLLERILLFFRKFRWVFVMAILLGLLSGLLVYRILPKIYTSTMLVHSFILTNQEQIQIVENWNSLLGKGEYTELAISLNCNESIFHRLKKIEAVEIQKVFSGVNPHGFTIEVNVTDNTILNELEKGIIYGFENSSYVRQRLDTKKDKLKTLIEETTKEIQKLDSTKKIVENIIAGKARSSSPLIIDASSTNRQMIEINEKLLAYKEDLKFTNAVQVLQGFSKFKRPTGPKLIPWLIIGLLLFLPLAFLYTVYRSLKGKLKTRSLQNKQVK